MKNFARPLLFWVLTVLFGSLITNFVLLLIDKGFGYLIQYSFEPLLAYTFFSIMGSALFSLPTLVLLISSKFYLIRKSVDGARAWINSIHITLSVLTFLSFLIFADDSGSDPILIIGFFVYAGMGQVLWDWDTRLTFNNAGFQRYSLDVIK